MMSNLDIDRSSLSQEPSAIELRQILREARVKFSPEGRRAEREAADERTRVKRRAFRAAKYRPTKVANRKARNLRHRTKLAMAMKLEDKRAATLIAITPCPAERLTIWLATSGREQARARGFEAKEPGTLTTTREAMLRAREQGVAVSWTGYAVAFTAATGRVWDRLQARRRVLFLTKLEGPAGPW